MNKKLKIYSGMFLLVVTFLIVTSRFNIDYAPPISRCPPDYQKLEYVLCDQLRDSVYILDTIYAGGFSFNLKQFNWGIEVAPSSIHYKALLSTVADQTYLVKVNEVSLYVPTGKDPLPNLKKLFFITEIPQVIIGIWIVLLIFKFIRKIRKGDVFVSQVSEYLERTGFLLIAYYVVVFIRCIWYAFYMANHVYLAGLHVVFRSHGNWMYIVSGLGLLIISQIIIMGKDLKEDVDLTV